MFNTPILFLVFNRIDTTQKVFEKIREVKPKQLFIGSDGPREHIYGEYNQVHSIRNFILNNIDWTCDVKYLFREKNLGCGTAVMEAIKWFYSHVERGIVLEDDCLPEISFFYFCETMLERYKDNDQIAIISGYNYLYTSDEKKIIHNEDYFFSRYIPIWGWASWKKEISKIEWDYRKLNPILSQEIFRKNFPQSTITANWLHSIIEKTFSGELNTWDTIMIYNIIVNKKSSIIPIKNQISNIGNIGTHADGKAYSNLFSKTYHLNVFQSNLSIDGENLNKLLFNNIENLIEPKSKLHNLIIRLRKLWRE